MTNKVVAKLAVGQVPDLDKSIPSSGNDKGDRLGRREAYARNPLGVAFTLVTRDLELALSKS